MALSPGRAACRAPFTRKCAFDVGDYGLGYCADSLSLVGPGGGGGEGDATARAIMSCRGCLCCVCGVTLRRRCQQRMRNRTAAWPTRLLLTTRFPPSPPLRCQGCDCLGHIKYFDAMLVDAGGSLAAARTRVTGSAYSRHGQTPVCPFTHPQQVRMLAVRQPEAPFALPRMSG
jgi:hypothetical protein